MKDKKAAERQDLKTYAKADVKPNAKSDAKVDVKSYAKSDAKADVKPGAKSSISQAVIKRLPRYYRYLGEAIEQNTERISSGELSKIMNVTASQIRQDLNNFGGFGQQGYGYNVKYLYAEIGKILGVDKTHNMIIIGVGNLGRALANYGNFSKRGFVITGLFDNNPELLGKKVKDVEIQSMDNLKDFIDNNRVDIVTLTIPKAEAEKVAKILCECDIKGIWNFAHTDLDVPSNIVVENVHLSESLMRLSYDINRMEEPEHKK